MKTELYENDEYPSSLKPVKFTIDLFVKGPKKKKFIASSDA